VPQEDDDKFFIFLQVVIMKHLFLMRFYSSKSTHYFTVWFSSLHKLHAANFIEVNNLQCWGKCTVKSPLEL